MNLPTTRNPVATRELLQGPTATQVATAMQQMGSKEAALAPAAVNQGTVAMNQAGKAGLAQQDTQQLAAQRLLDSYKTGLNEALVQATGQLPAGTKAMQERNLLGLSPEQVMTAAGIA